MSTLDDVIDQMLAQRLMATQQQAQQSAAIPTASVPTPGAVQQPQNFADQGSSFYDLQPAIGAGMAAQPYDVLGPEDDFLMAAAPKSKMQLTQESGVLNEGIPATARLQLSTASFYDPELQKKSVDRTLRRLFGEQGQQLVGPEYDFGLRVGPVSERLEFKDPRFNGKYNVVDPFGFDVVGDLADIGPDTLLPIALEVTAGLSAAAIPGVGQTGAPSIIASALAAGGASLARLYTAKSLGYLPEDITTDDILDQAFAEGMWSGAFGVGGAVAFKMFQPIFRAIGLANPKLNVDIDEDTFLRAYNRYIQSPAGKFATEKGITPSTSQMLEAAAQDTSLGLSERATLMAQATELSELEKSISRSPERATAEGVLTPSRQRTMAAEAAIRGEAAAEPAMPAGVVGTAARLGEAERAALGSEVQSLAERRAVGQRADLEVAIGRELNNIDAAIDDAMNMPSAVRGRADIGAAAKEAISDSYEAASARIGKAYEDLFARWSEATGRSLDDVVVGKGAIKPTEAVELARQLRGSSDVRPFADPSDTTLVNNVLDSFVLGEKGAIVRIKPISLRTLNENIRDLRRLERKAFTAAKSGVNAPSPEVIANMVDALEAARSRVISRKDAPPGLVEELRVLDDQFADFSTRFRDRKVSAVAKLRNAQSPEGAWNLLFQRDAKGGTAVLDIADELNTPANQDLFNDVGNAIRKEWLDKVVKRDSSGNITKIDLPAHNRFISEYGKAMDVYLTPSEKASMGTAADFAEKVTNIQARKAAALKKIDREFQLGGGDKIEPELVFDASWKEGRFTRFEELYSNLRQSPELLDTYKAFVYKDMFDPAAKRVKTVNGRQVIDPAEMRIYVEKNKDKMRTLFGQDYLNNLNTVLDVTEAALKEVPGRGRRAEVNNLTNFIRAYVGLFTRPGRFLTAFNNVRGRIKEDALTTALADPRIMAEMAKASKRQFKVKGDVAEMERTIGRIFGLPYTGGGRYDYAADADLDVPKPTREAAAILEALQN